MANYRQWSGEEDSEGFMAIGPSVAELPPGFYDIVASPQGLIWAKVDVRTDDILRFPDSNATKVIDEIEAFWDKEELFKAHSLPFKRGILMHGPPGSGKSTTLRVIAQDVVARKGYVVNYTSPSTLVRALRQLRSIQPEVPVVVLMEDLDAILKEGSDSSILNLLDGVEEVPKVVFLATTNYPDVLEDRIANRPSRFDRRILVDHPSADARLMYLESLMKPGDDWVNVDAYVAAMEGMSLAHLKELFVATVLLDCDFDETVAGLKGMKKKAGRYDGVEGSGIRSGQYV